MVVEDDVHVRFGMSASLRAAGFEVVEVEGCEAALASFRGERPDVVISDLRLPDGNAVDMLPRLRALDASVPVYVITGYGTIDVAVAAVKQGAEDFLPKPVDVGRLISLARQAVDRRTLGRTGTRTKPAADFVSTSDVMLRLNEQVERLRDADCSVLILGETGTGKTVLARRIHRIGARGTGPFVDVNCATFSRELVESELFGHERGAFTGAHAQKTGLFDAADQGTLFLDEIGDIDVQVQPKILKVLEDKRFRRVGSVREREVDVRLVAATHHDLLAAVARKTFRADLYYRVSTVTLSVPALRERRDDLLPLARHLVSEQCGEPVSFSRGAEEKLVGYGWPGNIRELKNVLERALLLRSTSEIREGDIRLDVDSTPASRPSSPELEAVPTAASSSRLLAGASSATRNEIEREHIQLALDAENGRVEAAARRLGMPRSTLYLKIKHYQMTVGRSSKSDKPTDP